MLTFVQKECFLYKSIYSSSSPFELLKSLHLLKKLPEFLPAIATHVSDDSSFLWIFVGSHETFVFKIISTHCLCLLVC